MRVHPILAALTLLPAALHAQSPRGDAISRGSAATSLIESHAGARSAVDTLAIMSMRSALRHLAMAQERYYGDHGTYTTDLAALGFWPTPRPIGPDATFVQVAFAGGRGWAAMATIRAVGKSCVMYLGVPAELPVQLLTRADKKPAEQEGAPTCDQP